MLLMSLDDIDYDYYVNVRDLMERDLPKPKHRSRFIVNYDEILPIILVDCGL